LLKQADERLMQVEGFALEDMAGQLYEERSRRGLGDFPLSERIQGYWDRSDVEIDLVAIAADEKRIRFGTCKRNESRLLGSIADLKMAAERFLNAQPRFKSWTAEYVAIAPAISPELAQRLIAEGVIPQDLVMLTAGLYGPSQPRLLGLSGLPDTRDGKLQPMIGHGVQCMSIGFLVDEESPVIWRGPMITQALTRLLQETHWENLDYLIVTCRRAPATSI